MNVTILRGSLSRPPEVRVLPSGDRLVAYEVTVEPGGASVGRAESVPVVWLAAPAAAERFAPDDEVVVVGRVRRRFFRAGGATQSRTEVVAHRVLGARRRTAVSRAVADALAEVDAAFGSAAGGSATGGSASGDSPRTVVADRHGG